MSCDNSTYLTAVVDLHLLSPAAETGDYAKAKETDLHADQSLKQGRPRLNVDESRGYRHELLPRIISDRTQIDPEHVWGDEGPINDWSGRTMSKQSDGTMAGKLFERYSRES